MTIGGFIGGMIIVVIGFMFVWKSEWLLQNFGSIGFAEKYLHGEGGSRLLYKLFGIIICIIGLLMAMDLMDSFMIWLVKTVFGKTFMK